LAKMTLEELAACLGATVVGDGNTVITGVAGIEEARKGEITFVANPRYRSKLLSTGASAAIVPPDVEDAPLALLVTAEPYVAFTKALEVFHPRERPASGISPDAWVDPSARVGKDVSIRPLAYVGKEVEIGDRTILYPFVYVGDRVRVGDDCCIYSHVSIREGCELGDRVILQNGVRVGSDGFGYAKQGNQHLKIPQVGIVRIEDDVEIGANTCIDRATMGETRIGRGTKIDNLVQLAHNVQVGEDVILVSQAGISGSTSIGDRAVLGGQVGVAGHVRIGRDVKIGAKSGVHASISDGNIVASGIPAMPYEVYLKSMAVLKQLPRMREKVRKLEKEVQALAAAGRAGKSEDGGTEEDGNEPSK
jgi:UDP-3-O-[3-hydroxymyristoyl] glucosamine N-acyltransferase